MIPFFYILQIIVAVLIILIVLFQKNEGGTSLLSSNTYNSFFNIKSSSANPLTRITIILGIVFFLNAVIIGALTITKVDTQQGSLLEAIKDVPTVPNTPIVPSKDVPLGK